MGTFVDDESRWLGFWLQVSKSAFSNFVIGHSLTTYYQVSSSSREMENSEDLTSRYTVSQPYINVQTLGMISLAEADVTIPSWLAAIHGE